MSQPSRRIKKELQILAKDKVEGIDIKPNKDNYKHFSVKIAGPPDTPYEGGIFEAELLLSDDYPMSAPKILFNTKIFHPNIDKLGRICLDILKNKWTPALQIKSVLLSLQALLASPDADDFLDIQAAELWKRDEKKALQKAKEWTQLYAMP